MKFSMKRTQKSVLSVLLTLCLLASCITVALVPTDAAQITGDSVSSVATTVYFTPYSGSEGAGWIKDNKTILSHYQIGNNWWDTKAASDTGRTIGGKRVYSVTVYPEYNGLDNMYFRAGSSISDYDQTANQIHPFSSYTTSSTFSGKYYNGSSWVTPSYDTFKLYNNGSQVTSFTYSSNRSYTASATLNAGTTYKLNVYDGKNYWANGDAGTITSTASKTMYRYGTGGSSDGVSITPEVTGTYEFKWVLNGPGSRDDAGSLTVTYPTIYTVGYTLGSNVNKGTVTGGTDNGSGTIKAASGSNVVINVTYDDGYEYDSSNSSLGGATASNSNKTFTFSSISGNKTISIKAKSSAFNVSVQAQTGGSVSPSSFTGLKSGEGGTITATPNTAQNYVFGGWEASPSANVAFDNASAATTTFTATGAATITAKFTKETLYAVTVKRDGTNAETYNAGSTINPEITAADRSDESYEFEKWELSGNVQLASGYSATDATIKIKATGSGGTVTAKYTKVDYIFFYAALQSNWNSNPIVTVNGSEVSAYAWLASKTASDTPLTLYSGSAATSRIGGNSCYTYYIGIYRVKSDMVGKNIYVANAVNPNGYGYAGTLQNDQGRCYYTYSTGAETGNTSGSIAPQKVTSVTTNKSDYDADETVTVSKEETVYANTKTAGQDDFTYTYKLINTATSVSKDLAADQPSSTGTYSFVPQTKSIAAGTYKVVIVTKDSKTGKIINSCESAAFTVQATPTQSAVNFTQTLSGASSSFTGSYKYKNGAATTFTSGTSLRAGSVVTLTLKLNTGYTQGTTTLTGIAASAVTESYNSSTNTVTFTFTVPTGGAAITVSHTAKEITHSITVKRRYFNYNGTSQLSVDSSAYKTLTGAGIATAVSTGAAPTVTNYTFKTFTLPSGVTLKSGSLTTTAAITVNATVDNATIYIDYWETVYAITVQNDGHGKVQRDNSDVTGTTSIGNVTAVTLKAVNNEGYKFKEWQITKGTATTATVGSTTSAETTFKFNGTATVKAVFEAVDISISASFASASYSNTNSVRVTDASGNVKQSGHIGDVYIIEVTLGPGYEVASIAGAGTTPTPTKSSNVWKYQYTLGASNVVATVTLKAATPTISNVQIKNTTFNFASPGSPTVNYYLQPTEVKATTDAFSTLGYNNTKQNQTGKASGAAVSLTQPDVTLNAENATANYTLTITATNAPTGVTAATKTETYAIQVKYNDAQKAYFKLQKLMNRCIREDTANNPYYNTGAPLSSYNAAYDTAKTFIDGGWPAYNATAADATAANKKYTDFDAAYEALMGFAKTTTVRVLTKYSNSSSAPINMYMTSNGNNADYNHFRMYNYGDKRIGDSDSMYHMTYKGYVTKSGTNYYMYDFTYAGHARFQVWRGSSAADVTQSGKLLTGTVTNATEFKNYYVNVYNTNTGATSVTTCTEYTDFGHTKDTGKKYVELNQSKTAAQIKSLFSIAEAGSIVSAPGGLTTTNTAFTISGPAGKATTTYDLKAGQDFPADVQGKYTVSYTTKFGTDENNNAIERTVTMTLWVAFDDISIYVDMNDNVGNPILNFKYYTDSNGEPASSGTTAYLPYEMDLVTGSESVYKYTIKISKLSKDYKIAFGNNQPIKISYITVENNKIGASTDGFDIGVDARITGEAWFKADSTKLKTFNLISYGSVTKSFIAVTNDSSHTVLPGINGVHGTGIITDEDDIFRAQYASLYTLDGATAPMSNFNYVVSANAQQEVKVGANTYYFDRWVTFPTPAEGISVDATTQSATLPATSDYSGDASLNFTKAPDYDDGNGDLTYVALFRLVSSGDQTVRVEVKYEFQDFDTSDGNYIYDANKQTVAADYTKTIKVQLGSGYADLNAVKAAADSIAKTNAPFVKSNYFDYDYIDNSAEVNTEATKEAESKIVVTAKLQETAHPYTIILKNGASSTTYNGYYQQSVTLNAGSVANPAWKDSGNNVLGTGATFNARYVSSGNEKDGAADCQIIKLVNDSAAAAANKSVVSNAYTEVYYTDNGTEMLRHNFYIIDYVAEGKLLGGGVLFATTDGTNYRQTNAATQLASAATRKNFITNVLNGDFATEYKAQTINNVGFRYKPYKNTEDVFRYSDDLKAYITMYEGTNINSENYENQTLRLFSFMVYDNNGTAVIVPSDGYAEVERYQPQSN